jgi:hypothetical protein
MKSKLTEAEVSALLPNIKRVLETGETWKDDQLHHPVDAIVSAILTIPGMARKSVDGGSYGIEGFDTNGWQWDWWQHFTHGDKEYTLSGSGYYGGHKFHVSD